MKLIALAIVASAIVGSDYSTKSISEKKAGAYSAEATYVVFKPMHPLSGTINPVLKSIATSGVTEWVKETKGAMKELGKPVAPWEYDVGMEVHRSTAKVVSIVVSHYDYSGGAHPNHGVETLNFGFISGKSRQLKLSDFFDVGFNGANHVSKLILAKLVKTEGADWVKNGELKKLDSGMCERFVIESDGLRWYFNPYDVGPYAAGDFEVKLSMTQLGSHFRRSMLVAR